MPDTQQANAEFMEDIFESATPADKAEVDAPPPEPTPELETPPPAADPPPAETAPAEPVPQDETPEAPAESGQTPVTEGLEHAAKAEREKRQALEQKLAELERQKAYLEGIAKGQQQQHGTQLQGTPEDQEAERQRLERLYFDDPVGYQEKRAAEIAETKIVESRIRDSAFRLAAEVPDYADVMKRFSEHANQPQNQYLWQQLKELPDPARQAYHYMKQLENPQAPFDPEAEREKIRAEERAKLEKERAGERADKVPRTPVSAPGAGPGAAPAKRSQTIDDLLEENEV